MRHLPIILLACLLALGSPGAVRADPVPQVYANPTLPDSSDSDPSLLGKLLLGQSSANAGKQLALTVTLYSAPTGVTTVGGSRFMVVMVSSDFVGTIQGCVYTGSGTAFQDAFQAVAPPGNYTIGPVTIVCTAGSYRVLDLR